jgi:glycosyltransferase involved in cell wall biosynthesis
LTGVKLAIVSPSLEDGGAESYIRMLTAGALGAGWDVEVAFPAREATRSLRSDLARLGARCRTLEIGAVQPRGRSGAIIAAALEALATIRLLRALRADATMVVLPHPDQTPGAVLGAALAPGVAVASVHLVAPQLAVTALRRRLYSFARSRGMRWIAVSQDNRRRLAAALGWPQAAIELVYNGIAAAPNPEPAERRAIAAAVREELGLAPEAKLLLSVGRLHRQKGHDQILDSIPAVLAQRTDAWWVWAGEGPSRGELEARIAGAPLGERVILLGRRADVRRLMLGSDALLFPSRYEGFPLTVIEAHMTELPVIASRAGPLPEVVRDRLDGLLVSPGDAAALACATVWALEHPGEMAAMAASARSRALSDLSIDAMTDATLALLQPPNRS